jgi:hypothetical protein
MQPVAKFSRIETKLAKQLTPTLGDLIDEYGKLTEELEPIKAKLKKLETLKERIKEKVDRQHEGKKFGVVIDSVPCETLDVKKIQEDMNTTWLATYTKKGVRRSITVFRVKAKPTMRRRAA